MKIIDKLRVANRILLTIEPGIPDIISEYVLIDGKEYPFDIAYDIKDTIGIRTEDEIQSEDIAFIQKKE